SKNCDAPAPALEPEDQQLNRYNPASNALNFNTDRMSAFAEQHLLVTDNGQQSSQPGKAPSPVLVSGDASSPAPASGNSPVLTTHYRTPARRSLDSASTAGVTATKMLAREHQLELTLHYNRDVECDAAPRTGDCEDMQPPQPTSPTTSSSVTTSNRAVAGFLSQHDLLHNKEEASCAAGKNNYQDVDHHLDDGVLSPFGRGNFQAGGGANIKSETSSSAARPEAASSPLSVLMPDRRLYKGRRVEAEHDVSDDASSCTTAAALQMMSTLSLATTATSRGSCADATSPGGCSPSVKSEALSTAANFRLVSKSSSASRAMDSVAEGEPWYENNSGEDQTADKWPGSGGDGSTSRAAPRDSACVEGDAERLCCNCRDAFQGAGTGCKNSAAHAAAASSSSLAELEATSSSSCSTSRLSSSTSSADKPSTLSSSGSRSGSSPGSSMSTSGEDPITPSSVRAEAGVVSVQVGPQSSNSRQQRGVESLQGLHNNKLLLQFNSPGFSTYGSSSGAVEALSCSPGCSSASDAKNPASPSLRAPAILQMQVLPEDETERVEDDFLAVFSDSERGTSSAVHTVSRPTDDSRKSSRSSRLQSGSTTSEGEGDFCSTKINWSSEGDPSSPSSTKVETGLDLRGATTLCVALAEARGTAVLAATGGQQGPHEAEPPSPKGRETLTAAEFLNTRRSASKDRSEILWKPLSGTATEQWGGEEKTAAAAPAASATVADGTKIDKGELLFARGTTTRSSTSPGDLLANMLLAKLGSDQDGEFNGEKKEKTSAVPLPTYASPSSAAGASGQLRQSH
ncbi:unnamed protein product, partial [Amoebophrya sp. A120]